MSIQSVTEKTFDNDVGVSDQGANIRVTRPADDGSHAMMEEPEEGRADVGIDFRGCRRPRASRISPRGFYLDDISPRVTEQVTAVGACDPNGEVDDPKFRQTLFHLTGQAPLCYRTRLRTRLDVACHGAAT